MRTNKTPDKKSTGWESLEERVHRHLNDINSKITDDDIRNVITELEIRTETKPELNQENEETRENDTDEEDKQTSSRNLLRKGYN